MLCSLLTFLFTHCFLTYFQVGDAVEFVAFVYPSTDKKIAKRVERVRDGRGAKAGGATASPARPATQPSAAAESAERTPAAETSTKLGAATIRKVQALNRPHRAIIPFPASTQTTHQPTCFSTPMQVVDVFKGAAGRTKDELDVLFRRARSSCVSCPALRTCSPIFAGAVPDRPTVAQRQVDAALAPKGIEMDWRLVRKVTAELGAPRQALWFLLT